MYTQDTVSFDSIDKKVEIKSMIIYFTFFISNHVAGSNCCHLLLQPKTLFFNFFFIIIFFLCKVHMEH